MGAMGFSSPPEVVSLILGKKSQNNVVGHAHKKPQEENTRKKREMFMKYLGLFIL